MLNIPTKVDGVDTLSAAEFNSLNSELKNAIESTGQTLAGGDLFQIAKAAAFYAGTGTFYIDTSTVNSYVLSPVGSFQAADALADGLVARFVATTTNTAAATVNINSLGAKSLVNLAGGTLASGHIVTGQTIEIVYDLGNDRFEVRPLPQTGTADVITDRMLLAGVSELGSSTGATKLFFAGATKLETTSPGAEVTGSLLDVDNSSDAGPATFRVRNSEGGCRLAGDGGDVFLDTTDSAGTSIENSLVARRNGATELYHDNAKKFETTTDGILTTGKLIKGTHSGTTPMDTIYHNSEVGYQMRADNSQIILSTTDGAGASSIPSITYDRNGSVKLLDNNVLKLETTPAGVEVTGVAVVTGDSATIQTGTATGASLFMTNTEGGLAIVTNGGIASFLNTDSASSNSQTALLSRRNGATELYYNAIKKFETTNTGVEIQGELVRDIDGTSVWTGSDAGGVTAAEILADTGFVVIPGFYYLETAGDSFPVMVRILSKNSNGGAGVSGGAIFAGLFLNSSDQFRIKKMDIGTDAESDLAITEIRFMPF